MNLSSHRLYFLFAVPEAYGLVEDRTAGCRVGIDGGVADALFYLRFVTDKRQPEITYLSAVSVDKIQHRFDRGGLSSTVASDESCYLTLLQRERYVVQAECRV